jgi:hypothetical protein
MRLYCIDALSLTDNNKLRNEYNQEVRLNQSIYIDLFNKYVPKTRQQRFEQGNEPSIRTYPILIERMLVSLNVYKYNTDGVSVKLICWPPYNVSQEKLCDLRANNKKFRQLMKLVFHIQAKYKNITNNDAR